MCLAVADRDGNCASLKISGGAWLWTRLVVVSRAPGGRYTPEVFASGTSSSSGRTPNISALSKHFTFVSVNDGQELRLILLTHRCSSRRGRCPRFAPWAENFVSANQNNFSIFTNFLLFVFLFLFVVTGSTNSNDQVLIDLTSIENKTPIKIASHVFS